MDKTIREEDGLLMRKFTPGEEVLPVAGEDNILITSALPYCNNVPHLGNIIGSTLSADCFARYCRSQNRITAYVCGTDEYGTATETQALKEGITPRQLCDKYYLLHKETYDWFELSFNHFGRTSTPQHTVISQDIYLNLYKNDLLEKETNKQLYCLNDEKFLADRFVEGTCPYCGYEDARGDQCDNCTRPLDPIELINPRCKIDKSHTVTTRTSDHMYIELNKLQPQLEVWIKESWKKGKWSSNSVINSEGQFIDARLKQGLRPSPVTRDLQWGVPVPEAPGHDDGMKGKVLYVWFDAPVGYPSITSTWINDNWKKWWFKPDDVKLYQFMGKDNVYFHIVLFPSMLIGDGRPWTKLHHISTTEYLNYEGGKFSKSRGVGVFGPDARKTGLPASIFRYYLLSARPETGDTMFSWGDLIAANNNTLIKNFGNFINRVLKFVAGKNYGGVLPDSKDQPGPLSVETDVDAAFVKDINALFTVYIETMDSVKLRQGLALAMQISSRGNQYLQDSGLDNTLFNTQPERCAQVILRAVNLIYAISAIIFPFMPAISATILEQMNAPARTVAKQLSIDILPGHQIGKPSPLFKLIDEKKADEWRNMFGGTRTPAHAPPPEPGVSKRKAASGKKAATVKTDGPKSPELVELEGKRDKQAQLVREIKAGKGPEGVDLQEALAQLLRLKASITEVEVAN
ncbi:methionyl-tRNA synthetase [Dacryopinax primogenitus]|uniref:methionine--tRNA ligase n=1 Tax=Dacryopinax primogenitus (strain DJM 731) TaxID=1858805 RepID=M5G8T3_DACPD|nr:methionyl-tRNA synthetase [Dacryopinax primogenitus]EJU04590.1 methionyl-tRNA synthetase [Dacryopinax primogenitus]